MTEPCDLCTSDALQPVYVPPTTKRGLKVHVCADCGLVQSLPRRDRAPRAEAAISAEADWGNLRYGKGFRTDAHRALLAALELPAQPRILDVGANRGHFTRLAHELWPDAAIIAVEPDERIADASAGIRHVELVRKRIEDCSFAADGFDFVYSAHTLEHLKSPHQTLLDHARILAPGGRLLIEVPNIDIIGSPDIVEEWFIDKHLYHFSAATLEAMLKAAGFAILSGPDPRDGEHLTILAEKRRTRRDIVENPAEINRANLLIATYAATRARNARALIAAARRLTAERGRFVIWGAGRIFDALVRVGGYDPHRLAGLVDEGLANHTAKRHGIALTPSNDLPLLKPDLVLIASRSFAGEIAAKVRELTPAARILTFSDLLLQSSRAA
ncbi:MAG: class I SAM-dependent methyltransferase [Alphaproteobacteria bacterium]